MAYSFTELQLRNTLASKNATIMEQYKKLTRKPRAKWLYFPFRMVRQIDEIIDNRRIRRILNYTPELVENVHLLVPPGEKILFAQKLMPSVGLMRIFKHF